MTQTVQTAIGVSCRNLTKDYGEGNARVQALRGVDLDIAPGELTLLVGPSGCGKTTLISILAGTLDPTGGELSVLGTDLNLLSKRTSQGASGASSNDGRFVGSPSAN